MVVNVVAGVENYGFATGENRDGTRPAAVDIGRSRWFDSWGMWGPVNEVL